MNLSCKAFAILIMLATGAVVHAAPPTVTPSPGYDARLQEQRAAAARATPTEVAPVAPRRQKKSRTH
jgi:hypothetical protein